MSKAEQKERLVERTVIGPKCIHYHDPDTGDRKVGNIGDTIRIPARSAKAFARYLESPEVAAAKREVAEAEARADAAGDDDNDDNDDNDEPPKADAANTVKVKPTGANLSAGNAGGGSSGS